MAPTHWHFKLTFQMSFHLVKKWPIAMMLKFAVLELPYKIIKWPTQVINWPTPLGCLNCWQMAVIGRVRKGGPIYARIGILIEKLAISLMIMDIFQASLFKLGTQVHN